MAELVFPDTLHYSEDHEWLQVTKDGEALVGISAFAQSELGDIVFVDVPELGEVAKGEVFGSIEAVKVVSDLKMPVSGTILEFNTALEDNPQLINSDPYGSGWILRIKMSAPAEAETLLTAQQYQDFIKK
ncbi:MAG: glycine cleavage system protein GcvH [Bacteroides sp.]